MPEQEDRFSEQLEDVLADANRAVRKVDFLVLPFVVLCFMLLQFDRTNLGNAQTDTILANLQITTATVNTGQTLFTLGFVLFELPSNYMVKVLGAQRWIPTIMFAWGLITLCQAFLKNQAGFYATRFLLASAEAGFIPGMAWYLTRFYPNGLLSLRFSLFWAANSFAGMVSGPLALGILQGLNGTHGWHGWQYLFAIEGAMTMAVAIFALLYLPAIPTSGGQSLLIIPLSRGDLQTLSEQVLQDDPQKLYVHGDRISFADVKNTLLDWRLWGHCISAFLSSIILTPVNTYGPSVIKALGYKGFVANGLTAPAAAIGLLVSVSLAWNSDRTRERGIHIFVSMALSCVGCLWLSLAPDSAGRRLLYGGYLMTAGTMATAQAINASWLSSRFPDRQRPVALACYVAFIQIAGFVGSNVFKPKDGPRYRKGLIICGVCALAGGAVALIWKALYAIDDKRRGVEREADHTGQTLPYQEAGPIGDDLAAKEPRTESSSEPVIK